MRKFIKIWVFGSISFVGLFANFLGFTDNVENILNWVQSQMSVNLVSLIVPGFSFAYLFWLTFPLLKSKFSKQEEIYSKTFNNSNVRLDGKRFHNCTFDNVTFRWDGKKPFDIIHCKINGASLEVQNKDFVTLVDMLKNLGFLEKNFAESWGGSLD